MEAVDLDAMPGSLLSENPKTKKSERHGYLTAMLHLAPARLYGRNVCPHSSPGCRAACLNTAGHGGIAIDELGLNAVQLARIRRKRWFYRDRAGFMAQLETELTALERRAARLGLKPAVRLNGTSDIPWEHIGIDPARARCRERPNMMYRFPSIQFYDYTKWPTASRRVDRAPGNYYLTFSLSEQNIEQAERELQAGVNVAVVLRVAKSAGTLPRRHQIGTTIASVIDGDEDDLRFLDPRATAGPGFIVGLRAKGHAIHDHSGFVQEPNYNV